MRVGEGAWKYIPEGNDIKEEDLTVPVRPDDFIHIQIEYLLVILQGARVNPPDYRIEKKYKERVIDNMYASKAQSFLSAEQQLGDFFQPIIRELIKFRDEVLIDFRGGNKNDS